MSTFSYTDSVSTSAISEAVDSVWYDSDSDKLVVEYCGGGVYAYTAPYKVMDDLRKAIRVGDSIGSTWVREVKRNYGPGMWLGNRNQVNSVPRPRRSAVGTPKALVDKTVKTETVPLRLAEAPVQKWTVTFIVNDTESSYSIAGEDLFEALDNFNDLAEALLAGTQVEVEVVGVEKQR